MSGGLTPPRIPWRSFERAVPFNFSADAVQPAFIYAFKTSTMLDYFGLQFSDADVAGVGLYVEGSLVRASYGALSFSLRGIRARLLEGMSLAVPLHVPAGGELRLSFEIPMDVASDRVYGGAVLLGGMERTS